jgi:hypothetical protein
MVIPQVDAQRARAHPEIVPEQSEDRQHRADDDPPLRVQRLRHRLPARRALRLLHHAQLAEALQMPRRDAAGAADRVRAQRAQQSLLFQVQEVVPLHGPAFLVVQRLRLVKVERSKVERLKG